MSRTMPSNSKFTSQLQICGTTESSYHPIGQYVKDYSVLRAMQVKDGVTNTLGTTSYTKLGYKRKITITTNYMTASQLATLNSYLTPFSLRIYYWDPYTGNMRTSECYIADTTTELYLYNVDNDTIIAPFEITFIETTCTNN